MSSNSKIASKYLLGTLLVSKFHQIAISRQTMEAENRRPFFLYIDEFHHFVSPSMASILTGVRRYRLGLILAHQNLTQLRDADVANSVLSSPYARICFRVGDQDAKRVAESLSFFESSDLLNLGKGEAICRIQKNDWDFNLETIIPPRPTPEDAKHRRETLHYLTRLQYGMPREKVEEELAKTRVPPAQERVDPFAKRTEPNAKPSRESEGEPHKGPAKSAKSPSVKNSDLDQIEQFYASPDVSNAPGLAAKNPEAEAVFRNAEEIKNRIIQHGGKLGFSYEEEKRLPDEKRVDIVLSRGQVVIACEISATTSAEHEIKNIEKCIRHGHREVFHVCNNRMRRCKIAQLMTAALTPQEIGRVQCVSVSDFLKFLNTLPSPSPNEPPVAPPRSTLTDEALSPDLQKALEQDMLRRLRQRLNRDKQ